MLYKGKQGRYYLYELTSSDLLLEEQGQERYVVGNVLLFTNKRKIALGAEAMKADDYTTAVGYLENRANSSFTGSLDTSETIASLKNQLEACVNEVQAREDLLLDLTADLESQRHSNMILITQLESLREQISIEQITRNEVMGDLEIASAETFRKDEELQRAIEAKTRLEQELAERICELLELDSANSELQQRLQESRPGSREFDVSHATTARTATESAAPQETQILTLPSGKQIHIYHEFPAKKTRGLLRGSSVLWTTIRVVGLLLVGFLVLISVSVLATSYTNGISLGDALDTLLKATLL